jgi:hypothetical protein
MGQESQVRLFALAKERYFKPGTLAGDRGYDTRNCVDELRRLQVTL